MHLLAGTTDYTWDDMGKTLTCSEADALREVLRLLGLGEWSERLYDAHMDSDDEGDAHWEIRLRKARRESQAALCSHCGGPCNIPDPLCGYSHPNVADWLADNR